MYVCMFIHIYDINISLKVKTNIYHSLQFLYNFEFLKYS